MASDMTPLSLEALAERADEEQTFWVRAAVCRQRGGQFQLRMLEVIGGEPPVRWNPRRWAYPDAIFLALAVPAALLPAGSGTVPCSLTSATWPMRRFSNRCTGTGATVGRRASTSCFRGPASRSR